MFSAKLDRRRRIRRFAVLVAATVLAAGIALIAVWAVQGLDMLQAMDTGPAPILLGALIAFVGLLVLCLVAYAAVRAYGRVTSR